MIKIEFKCDVCGNESGKLVRFPDSPIPYIVCNNEECQECETIKQDNIISK